MTIIFVDEVSVPDASLVSGTMELNSLIDDETGEVIRQISPEELIEVSGRLQDLIGLLVDVES